MNIEKTAKTLIKFLRMTEAEVVAKFVDFHSDAVLIPTPNSNTPSVYIPGKKGMPLLVAHSDTVWDKPVKPSLDGAVIYSARSKTGIGADDRAGVALLWALRSSGCGLLICAKEEIGCVGASAVASNAALMDEIGSKYTFLLEFDRRGSHDFVTYECENADFDTYIWEMFPGFSKASGSFSDIAVLGKACGLASANLSIGFRNEHTEAETLDIYDWARTVSYTKSLALDPSIPTFKHICHSMTGDWFKNDLDADWAEVARTENNQPIDTYTDQDWFDYCNSTGDWK